MNRTAPKKGAAGKFLALLASLTMIVAGLVGVAFAAPASAEAVGFVENLNPAHVGKTATTAGSGTCPTTLDGTDITDQDVWHFVFIPEYLSAPNIELSFAGSDWEFVSWQNDANPYKGFYVKTAIGAVLESGMATGTVDAAADNAKMNLSHACPGTAPTASVKVTKEWVVTTNDGESAAPTTTPGDGFSAQLTLDDVVKVFGTTYDGYKVDAVVDVDETEVMVPENCEWKDSSGTGEKTLEKAGLNEFTVTNYVDCTTSPDDASVNVTKVWVVTTNNGTPAAPTSTPGAGFSAQLTLNAASKDFGTTYSGYTAGDVVAVAETGVTVPANCAVASPASSGTGDKALVAGLNSYTVTNYVNCTVNTTPTPTTTTTTTTPDTPAVVPPVAEAVAIELPVALPATVAPAKPAKKPVVVSAPKPAKVEGGVANTVSVPEAATVPAAVPAGDGSQAPGLPMWALALVVVGALGAAAAGKQILGARN